MPERGVSQIVAKRDRLGEVLIEAQGLSDRTCYLSDLERVCETRAVVIALRGKKDLRLVGEATKRLAVDDPVAIALVIGAIRVRFNGTLSAPGRI